jgi:hypothetical protein
MRLTHRQSPFHRIECWTGTHFRRAELWEVGTYILVQHQTDQPICNALDFQMKYLETFEDMKDKAEQESTNWQANDRHRPSSPDSASGMTGHGIGADEELGAEDETGADSAFFDHLDALWRQGRGNIDIEDSLQDFFDGNDEDEVEHADEDIHGFQPYLPNPNQTADANLTTTPNSYIRVVHTNGIHHLVIVFEGSVHRTED